MAGNMASRGIHSASRPPNSGKLWVGLCNSKLPESVIRVPVQRGVKYPALDKGNALPPR